MKKLFLLAVMFCFSFGASAQIETVVDTLSSTDKYTLVKYTYVQDTTYFDEKMEELQQQLEIFDQDIERAEKQKAGLLKLIAKLEKGKIKAVKGVKDAKDAKIK